MTIAQQKAENKRIIRRLRNIRWVISGMYGKVARGEMASLLAATRKARQGAVE